MISSVDDATEALWVTRLRRNASGYAERHSENPAGPRTSQSRLRAIAKCRACDDVVFACGDGTFAIVHLSYQPDERPRWPDTSRLGPYLALSW